MSILVTMVTFLPFSSVVLAEDATYFYMLRYTDGCSIYTDSDYYTYARFECRETITITSGTDAGLYIVMFVYDNSTASYSSYVYLYTNEITFYRVYTNYLYQGGSGTQSYPSYPNYSMSTYTYDMSSSSAQASYTFSAVNDTQIVYVSVIHPNMAHYYPYEDVVWQGEDSGSSDSSSWYLIYDYLTNDLSEYMDRLMEYISASEEDESAFDDSLDDLNSSSDDLQSVVDEYDDIEGELTDQFGDAMDSIDVSGDGSLLTEIGDDRGSTTPNYRQVVLWIKNCLESFLSDTFYPFNIVIPAVLLLGLAMTLIGRGFRN